MSKIINKAEREEILLALVVEASLKSAQKICNKLFELRARARQVLLAEWERNMPNISRADQLELLRSHAANALTFSPTVYGPGGKNGKASSEGEFGKLGWSNDGIPSNTRERLSILMSRIFSGIPGRQGQLHDGISNSWSSSLSLSNSYPDLIRGFQPGSLYRAGVAPDSQDQAYVDSLLAIHDAAQPLLKELKDLLFAAEDMYHSVGAVIAPLKTAQKLAEAMPEAVKHFPPSLTYVKPTKEIADPKAINEIRAKLAKGLPV